MLDFDKNDIMRAVELGILLVVAALMVFFVVRPMLKTAGSPSSGPAPALASAASGGGGHAALGLSGPVADGLALPGPSEMDQRIDIARIEGQVKASSVKKVADFVDKHPEESVSILRGWLHET
jgi:flagellar M-ring protein FliF